MLIIRFALLMLILGQGSILCGQVYTVNSSNDVDDGKCDGIHCSFREALNASDKDGIPSIIRFNIPGVAPYTIVPQSPFPTVNDSDLSIEGESQPGGPGSLIIDFQQKDFKGIPFWIIKGYRFYLSGIDFTNFFTAVQIKLKGTSTPL